MYCMHSYVLYAFICTYMHSDAITHMHSYVLACFHMYLLTCIHMYLYAFICTCMHSYVLTHMHSYVLTCIQRYLLTWICMYSQAFICTRVYFFILTCVRIQRHGRLWVSHASQQSLMWNRFGVEPLPTVKQLLVLWSCTSRISAVCITRRQLSMDSITSHGLHSQPSL